MRLTQRDLWYAVALLTVAVGMYKWGFYEGKKSAVAGMMHDLRLTVESMNKRKEWDGR